MTSRRPRLVVLTGAGISAESGLKTFRGEDGLWEGHRVEDVATPEAWAENPRLVLDFYNQRRAAARSAVPNAGHVQLAGLERHFDVDVVTQNVDDLHERAGSSRVLHLHGSLFESRSSVDEELVFPIQGDLRMGDLCPRGSQLRPNIVWFGEAVPRMYEADRITRKADAFLVVGTSLAVYPAAGLVWSVPRGAPIFVVDPGEVSIDGRADVTVIREPASIGMTAVTRRLSELFHFETSIG